MNKPTFEGSLRKHFPGIANRLSRAILREVRLSGRNYGLPARNLMKALARSSLVSDEVRAKILAIEKDWEGEVQREWGDPDPDPE